MGRMKLCFFDDYWVDYRIGTIRRWYEPKYGGFYRDPEFGNTNVANLKWCPEVNKYRLFYNVWPDMGIALNSCLCLAESEDGVSFAPAKVNDRPEKQLQHIVWDAPDGLPIEMPTDDVCEKDPQKRYKCAALRFNNPGDKLYNEVGMYLCTSPDCIEWTVDFENPVHNAYSDAENTIIFNPYTEEYMMFFRAAFLDRRICMKTSKDLINWSDSVCNIHPGSAYNNEGWQTQLYGMTVTYADGIFYGTLQLMYTNITAKGLSKMWGSIDSELYYSYDGMNYMPTSGRPMIQRPGAPEYGCRQLYMYRMAETKDGNEYIIPGLGSRCVHGTPKFNREQSALMNNDMTATVLYRIRKDGFCGLEAIGDGGELITKSMMLDKDDLTFNINASCAASARFGLMDDKCSFINGFSYEECERFTGDCVNVAPKWKSRALKEAVGSRVRVAVELNSAVLHAMSGTARPYNVGLQRSFAMPDQILGTIK